MLIEIDLTQSLDENAGRYFELAKKQKRKIVGAQTAIKDAKKKLKELLTKEEKFQQDEFIKASKITRPKEWFEKFHWFESSEGLLCIGGRDATSNEILIKKHLEPNDLVFHTDAPGSPFFVIKNGINATNTTIQETAQAVAVYSKAWKQGHSSTDVFYVKPDQVTKEAKSGEYMSKGSFMIYGKREYIRCNLEYTIGLLKRTNEQAPIIIGGPRTAIESKTKNFITLLPGDEKKSDTCKKIKQKLGEGDIDEIMPFVPSGGAEIKKEIKTRNSN